MPNLTPPLELPESPQIKFKIEQQQKKQVNFVKGCREDLQWHLSLGT